jgi:D-3-phosphoglycerate dehydrogenase / 2-oxoglutarate reductase
MDSKMKVIFLDEVHEVLEQRLRLAGYTCVQAYTLDKQTCIDLVKDAVGIVIRSRFPMDESFLFEAKNLKFIARSGAGMENIDEAFCTSRKITCFNAPEGNRNAVGEHALGMLLAIFNNLIQGNEEVRRGEWNREKNRGVELDGKTIGIIGYGNNGQAFAKKLKGFDVQILAYDKYKTGFSEEQVKEATMDEIFEQTDVLSFHIPQNEETLFMGDDAFFDKFHKSIYLLNLSRGKIVKTSALVQALEKGKIIAAGLDVLEFEKASFETFFDGEIPDELKYLIESNKLLLSPHVGGWTQESYFKLSDVLADKILATNFQ